MRPLDFSDALWRTPECDLSRTARSVMSVLVAHANNATGIAYPSISRIAKCALLGASTVRVAIDELEAKGWVEREHRRTPDGAPTSNLYYLPEVPPTASTVRRDAPVTGGWYPSGRRRVLQSLEEGTPVAGANLLRDLPNRTAQGTRERTRVTRGASRDDAPDPWGLSSDGDPDGALPAVTSTEASVEPAPATLRRPTETRAADATVSSPSATQDAPADCRTTPGPSDAPSSPQRGAQQATLGLELVGPGPAKTKARKPPSAKAQGTNLAVACFVETHKAVVGKAPDMDGRMVGALKNLVCTLGVEAACESIRTAYEVIATFKVAFRNAREADAVVDGAIFEAGRKLVSALGLEPAQAAVRKAFADTWFVTNTPTLQAVASNPNKWVGQARTSGVQGGGIHFKLSNGD